MASCCSIVFYRSKLTLNILLKREVFQQIDFSPQYPSKVVLFFCMPKLRSNLCQNRTELTGDKCLSYTGHTLYPQQPFLPPRVVSTSRFPPSDRKTASRKKGGISLQIDSFCKGLLKPGRLNKVAVLRGWITKMITLIYHAVTFPPESLRPPLPLSRLG